MMKMRILYYIIPALLLILSCEDKESGGAKFNYPTIIDKEYRSSVGRVIPITIGQAIETDGDISRDGEYFFYSSNSDGGNFDIYLRSMTDITTVRITSHPSKDISPVISPNGKKLAFVSFRDDPDGDIFVMKIDPEKLIKSQKKSISALSSLDAEAKNITIEREPESEVVVNVKDSNPVWSPDGDRIAYASSKGGSTNIWSMNSDGSDKRKLTEKGGQYPSYSADGTKIVFVSYRDNVNGEIYTLDIKSGRENRITSDKNLKLYPSFMNDESRIIYSSIERDTNGNGALDLQDRSVLRYIDTKNGLSYPLTKYSDSSFKAKWLPVLSTRDYNGIIIYTDITGENINLNIIPETGIIPKKQNAKLQYDMCGTYLGEYDDTEKYLLSLESVYNYYNRNTDNASKAYVNRALGEAAFYYKKSGDAAEAKRIISVIRKRSEVKDIYASFILEMIEKSVEVKSETDIVSVAKKFGTDKNALYFIPFALEDISDTLIRKNDFSSARRVLNYITAKHSDFERILDIHTKISLIVDDLRKNGISESAIKVLNTGSINQKISVTNNLVEPFGGKNISSSESEGYFAKIAVQKLKFKDDKKIMAILSYISGLLYDVKGLPEKSREELLMSITLSHPNDFAYYLSNIKLGEIERRDNRFVEAEKYFSAAVGRYSRSFKTENFRERLLWLINYYAQSGEKNSQGGKFKDAAENYDKLINVLTLLHNKRLFPEVYTEFAPKAHVRYIDSYTSWKGEASITELEEKYGNKNQISVYRMDFNRAAIYGLAYIYTKKAGYLGAHSAANVVKFSSSDVYEAYKKADEQLDWALFMDDTFIEPYILKSWIYQLVDSDRNSGNEDAAKYAGEYFPNHLWEENIVILEKALNVNDENVKPENEGDLHLNMANNYFLLQNYPLALKSYRLAEKYKKNFGSDIEKALFHFHLGYTLWQNEELKAADAEIKKAFAIYSSLSLSGGSEKYKYQYLTLYRYFALFSRYENKYADAVSWYRKILKFAETNKLDIDRARYYQEIAYCFIKTGKYDSARLNLDRAASLLEKYPDDERKYYLKIKLFGLIPIFGYNLGADAAVVGENKIFYPLDTQSKKLLNLSMLEEISLADGDYAGAMKILKEKIALLESSSTSVAIDTRIRSLNNLGYYSYISVKYDDAEKYFNQAGDLATSKGNLEGTKSSMMNLVNLYASMIEDDKNADNGWVKKITALTGKLDSYRKNYYDQRLAQEMDSLKQKAKAKKQEVTEQQVSEVTKRVEQEAVSIYYSLDVSSAILKFYLADILYASDPAVKKNNPDAMELYSVNRDIFNLYKNALKNFESAIDQAEKSGKKELKARLSLNAGSCYERTGDYEKAYVSLLDAKNIGEQYSLSWIKINAYHKLGNFLFAHGKDVEKSDSSTMADKYFNSALSVIEEYPALYSSHSNRIRIIYSDYLNFLVDRGSGNKAFEIAERYAQASRIISLNSMSPKFSNEYDRKSFYEYTSAIGKLNSMRNSLSSKLLSGSDPLSVEITALKKNMAKNEEDLRTLLKQVRNETPAIKLYVEMTGYKTPSVKNEIFSFHQTEKGLYYWKLSQGKLLSGYVKGQIDAVIAGNSGIPVFILLSDTVIGLVGRGELKSSSDYVFINTLDRIPDFVKDSNTLSRNIYSEESGIRGAVVEGVTVTEGKDKPLSDFPLIIDRAGTGFDLTPEELFSSSLSPACLVQTGIKTDYRYLTTLIEGALYAGTKRIIVTPGTGPETLMPLIGKIFGKSEPVSVNPFFTLGYINTYIDKFPSDDKQAQDKELSLFSGYMKSADYPRAEIHLTRWNSLQKEKKSAAYVSNLWMLQLLSGRVKNSLAVLDSYTAAGVEELPGIRLRRAYSYFYSGDLTNAAKEIGNIAGSGAVTEDIKIFNVLIKMTVEGDLSGTEIVLATKKPLNTILPPERYLVPMTEFLYLNKDERAVKIASLIPDQHYLSENEYLMMNIISGLKPPAGRSVRFDKISELLNIENYTSLREEAQKLIRGQNGIDSLSVYPVLAAAVKYEGRSSDDELMQLKSSVNIDNIIQKGDPLSSLILLKKFDRLFAESENYQERVSILKSISGISTKNSFNSTRKDNILDQAMNYLLMQNFSESYDAALSAEDIFVPEDKSYADMQLLRMTLYIMAGKFKEASVKGELLGKMENITADRKYMLTLNLSLLELNRLRTLKQASVSDAAQFEKLFSSALSLVKHNTELLNRKGYREITGSIFDEFINYKMKTGQHTDAQYYNEVKKLLLASSKCGRNLFQLAGTIDMEAVQQVIPVNGVYVNVAKIKNDLFVWAADRKTKQAFVIENGYSSFSKFTSGYNIAISSGKDLGESSKELAKILSPLYQIMKEKKVILVSTDSESEKIPFEIAGENEMISDKSLFLYIPSLLVSTAGGGSIAREVYLPDADSSMAAYLGRVAVKESGIKFSSKPVSNRGMVHLTSKIRYNQRERSFTYNDKNIKSLLTGGAVLFAPAELFSGAGNTDFLVAGKEYNLQAVLINGSQIQDANSALFTEEFYRNAARGASLLESMSNALNRVKRDSRYSYPSNWSGYRLSIYDLNLLNQK